jgi:hypothetical protein
MFAPCDARMGGNSLWVHHETHGWTSLAATLWLRIADQGMIVILQRDNKEG